MRRFLSWVRSLVWRPARSRFIFQYHDGIRSRRADPFVIYRGFETHPTFNWKEDPKLLGLQDNAVVLETSEKMAAAVRDVFDLPPFDAGGLTEQECQRLFFAFCEYTQRVKKNGSPPQISPESTESTCSESSDTRPASDSTSMETGSSCETPITPARPSAGL